MTSLHVLRVVQHALLECHDSVVVTPPATARPLWHEKKINNSGQKMYTSKEGENSL